MTNDFPASASDPDTSIAAAASIEPTELEARVLAALHAHPNGATTHELARCMDLNLVTVSPRMRPLVNKGKVVDSGRRKCGESGRRSIVWRLAFSLQIMGAA